MHFAKMGINIFEMLPSAYRGLVISMLGCSYPQGKPDKNELFRVVKANEEWELVIELGETGIIRIVDVASEVAWLLNIENGHFFCFNGEDLEVFKAPFANANPVAARFLNEADILVADKNLGLCKYLPHSSSYYVVADECKGIPFVGINSITMDGYGGAYVSDATSSGYFKRDGKIYYVWFRDGDFDVELFQEGVALASCTAVSENDNLFIGEFATNSVICVPSKAAQGRVETPSMFMYHDNGHGPTGLAVDSYSNVYASFEFCHDILVSSQNGSQKTRISLPECAKSFPSDIYIDGDWLYVVEGTEGALFRIKLSPSVIEREIPDCLEPLSWPWQL